MSRIKAIIFFTLLVDVIGLGIVIPVLPFYVESFGVGALTLTLLFSVFSLCSFVSSPLLGVMSDIYGRRPVLIISIMSTALGWLVFASAHSVAVLFLGRIIDGLAAGNLTTAQSSLVDIAKDPKERTANLSLLGIAFGIGFVLGPLLGGVLGHFSPALPFWFAGGLAAVNAFIAYLYLPETNAHMRAGNLKDANPFAPLYRAATDTDLRGAYAAWLFFMLGISSVQSIFSLYMKDTFGIGALGVGLLFTATGIMLAVNQGFLLQRFWLARFREPDLEMWLLAATIGSYVVMTTRTLALFVPGFIVGMIFGQSILRAVMTSQVAGAVSPDKRGETLGTLSSISFVAMTAAPMMAGALFEFREELPFFLGAAFLTVALVVAYTNRQRLARITPAIDPRALEVG